MSNNRNDLFKISKERDTFVKASKNYDVHDEKVFFSFDEFNGNSVLNERVSYNSFYQNIESSRNAVGDFFKIVKELSKYKLGELMSSKSLREAYHINCIDRSEHIERIEKVLKENYGYPEGKINEFDQEYYEFQISDGKRVIWYKVDNIVHPLFIDCNHMICIESSKIIKTKMNYSIISSFSHLSEEDLNAKDTDLKEFIIMIIEEAENGGEVSIESVVELLKDSIDYKK